MLARSSQGAVIEDDGQLTLSPIVLPQVIVGTPIDLSNIALAASVMNQSFIWGSTAAANGVAAGSTVNAPKFAKGMWHLKLLVDYAFSGTVNFAALDAINLTKLDGTTVFVNLVSRQRLVSPAVFNNSYEFWICLPDDGSRFQAALAATVAGDLLQMNFTFIANKIW